MVKFLSYKGRSTWKNFFFRNVGAVDLKDLARCVVFSKGFLNKKVVVYNGKRWYRIVVSGKMLGYKAGQFVFTKKTGSKIHNKVVKGKNKNKKGNSQVKKK